MSYLIAAYGITALVLVVYVGLLHRERDRLENGE
jgi:hypothetical protein